MKKKTGLKTSGISLFFCLELGWVAKLVTEYLGKIGEWEEMQRLIVG